MAASGLKEYLSKSILTLKDILPSHPFLNDQEEIALISRVQEESFAEK
jgi:hypothetical protein